MTTTGSNLEVSAASAADGAYLSDDTLYDRMLASLLGSWTRIAEGTKGASVERVCGAAVAVFPSGPERFFYNNAVLARDPDGLRVGEAAAAIVRAYEDARIDRYAIWVLESEEAAIAEMNRRGFRVETSTRAMAMSLHNIAVPCPEIELGPPDWNEYLRIIEVPDGMLAGVDASDFHVLVARLEGENVAAGMAYDHGGDAGIFNMGTLPHARRRGLGTALTALHLYRARERGCATASLQSTEMGEGLYTAVGFRDLGRFIEYVR
jgi:ribosomal protein S18 acetylase RimI-like enzyme